MVKDFSCRQAMPMQNSESGKTSWSAETVVLTATFTPGQTPFVAISDTAERKLQYFSALLCWLQDPCIEHVVLCENSGTGYDFSRFMDVARRQGKRLEIITFRGNAESALHGKGFGEGKILEHVMHRSSILQSCTAFFKCTGRVYVSNFSEISARLKGVNEGFFPLDMTNSIANQALGRVTFRNAWSQLRERRQKISAFSRKAGFPVWNPRLTKGCDTRFFKSGTYFFRNHLSDQYHAVDDYVGYYLEHAYYYCLKNKRCFWTEVSPLFMGRSGTGGCELHSSFPEAIVEEAAGFL